MDQREKVITINEWIAREVMLRVIEKLDVDRSDGDQTYLDNSLVFWGNELGMNHLNYSVPVLLAGSLGGHFKTGRYIDYIDWNRSVKFSQHNGMVIEGVPYNRLLVSILQGFGLEPSDYERSARPGLRRNANPRQTLRRLRRRLRRHSNRKSAAEPARVAAPALAR